MKPGISFFIFHFSFFICGLTATWAQGLFGSPNLVVSGYLENLQVTVVRNFEEPWSLSNSVDNRLDLHVYPSSTMTAHVGLRNVLTFGGLVEDTPNYDSLIGSDPGFFDLTFLLASGQSYVLLTGIDRANLHFNHGNLDVQIGRQRVNWGLNLIWNPNDIFNTASYFDFSYIEKPGSDAVRLQYYTGALSSIQVAAKLDRNRAVTVAGLFRFNKWKYDFQFLTGVMDDTTWVVGGGWSGQIGGAGFNGEASYFYDFKGLSGEQFVLSTGTNYTFPSSLYLQFSLLYNSTGTTGPAGFDPFLSRFTLTARTLTAARYSLFGQLAYDVTPLIRVTLADIFNPSDQSTYLSPWLEISLKENITFSFVGQLLFGAENTEFSSDFGKGYYLWLKWNF